MRKPGQRVTGRPARESRNVLACPHDQGDRHGVALDHASVVYQHSAGTLRIRQPLQCRIHGETMMHVTVPTKTRASARPRRTRPKSAPAYYLGRPASFWIAVTTRHPVTPDAGRKAA